MAHIDDNGTLYVLKNQAMPGIYKIGMTRGRVLDRANSLRSTGVPLEFEILHVVESDYILQLEKYVHRRIRTNRVTPKREFFSFGSDDLVISAVNKSVERFSPREYTTKEKKRVSGDVNPATPAKRVKKAGLESLKQMADLQGFKPNGRHVVDVATLRNWFYNKPQLFRNLLDGCVYRIRVGK